MEEKHFAIEGGQFIDDVDDDDQFVGEEEAYNNTTNGQYKAVETEAAQMPQNIETAGDAVVDS